MSVYKIVTDQIISRLDEGTVPWQKNWTTGFPINFITGKPYRGINIFLLGLQDYQHNYWLSFKQCKDLGGSVKKGEKSSLVVFWKPINKKIEDENGDITFDTFFLLRYYRVFNVEQCDLPENIVQDKYQIRNNSLYMNSESVVSNFKNKPTIY